MLSMNLYKKGRFLNPFGLRFNEKVFYLSGVLGLINNYFLFFLLFLNKVRPSSSSSYYNFLKLNDE
jgi:hypothetical protein